MFILIFTYFSYIVQCTLMFENELIFDKTKLFGMNVHLKYGQSKLQQKYCA